MAAEFRNGHVARVDLSQKKLDIGKQPIEVDVGSDKLLTRTLIIASGASARWLGLAKRAGADRARRFVVRYL